MVKSTFSWSTAAWRHAISIWAWPQCYQVVFIVKRFLDGSYAPGGQFFKAAHATTTAATGMFNPQMSLGENSQQSPAKMAWNYGDWSRGWKSNHVELSFAGFLMDMRVSNFCLSLPEAMYILYTYIICIYVYTYIYIYIYIYTVYIHIYIYIYIQYTYICIYIYIYPRHWNGWAFACLHVYSFTPYPSVPRVWWVTLTRTRVIWVIYTYMGFP